MNFLQLFNNPVFIVGLILVGTLFLIYLVLIVWRYFVLLNQHLPAELRQKILLVSVPKDSVANKQDEGGVSSAEQIQQQIGWAESWWSSLGNLKSPGFFKTWLYGRQDQISLEIVAKDNLIFFYVVTPAFLEQYMEQQLQAQYPHAQIELVNDYNVFQPEGFVKSAYLKLSRPNILPIKTYRKMEGDPLNAVTNSLSKLKEDEGAVVQLTVRPVAENWYQSGRKAVSKIMETGNVKKVLKEFSDRSSIEKIGGATLKGLGNVHEAVKTSKNEEDQKLNNRPNELTPFDQELIKSIEEKSSKAALEANLRVLVSSSFKPSLENNLNNILNSFAQYNIYEYGNSFKKINFKNSDKVTRDIIHRNFSEVFKCVLNTEELASVFHFPLPSCPTPNIHWLGARSAPAPTDLPKEGVILGKNIYRGKESLIRLNTDDRRRHVYIIGMTGTGKSTLMVNMAVQDIQSGKGVCYIDPHGNGIDEIIPAIPEERLQDVVYFDPGDTERPMGLNLLEAKTAEEKDFATQEMIQIFYKLVSDPQMIGPMFEHYMRNAMLLLMADKDDPGTIVEIARVFTDDEFRKAKLAKCNDLMVKSFWEKEYAQSQRGSSAADMLSYVISKVGRFVENDMMRNIIGQPQSGFNMRDVMDNKKIVLANLSKGKIGEVNSDLLGLIFVSKLQMAALARANQPESERQDFYLYIDEFQNYVTDSIATILAEARKYRLNLIMAHQYISQLVKNQDTGVRDAVFGNAGTMVCYRIGVEDAETMAKQYAPVFNEFDLMNIEKYKAYVRLLINNQAARPFNMQAFPPVEGDAIMKDKIIQFSREKYGQPRAEVETEILRRSRLGETEETEQPEKEFDFR